MSIQKITLGINEYGHRVGESHQRAKLTDEQVEHIRDLHEEGFVGYRTLARMFGVARSTISDICAYRRRNTYPVSFRTVTVRITGATSVSFNGKLVKEGEAHDSSPSEHT